MSVSLKRLAIVLSLAGLSACASSPLDFIAPADMALIRSETTAPGSGPISIDDLLRNARGETEAPAAPAQPVSVADMLAAARDSAPSGDDEWASTATDRAPAENTLAENTLTESAYAETTPPAPIDDGPITLDQLRAQVMRRDAASDLAVSCK